MKTRIKLLVILVLVLATFSHISTTFGEGPLIIKDKSAFAFFFEESIDGCIGTEVELSATDLLLQSPSFGPRKLSSNATLSIFQFDSCTFGTLLGAMGFTELADPDFQVSASLASATLNATVTVFDAVSETSFDLFVNVSWTSDGPIQSLSTRNIFGRAFSACPTLSRDRGSSRPAEASGTVSDGATTFISGPSIAASLESGDTGLAAGCTK